MPVKTIVAGTVEATLVENDNKRTALAVANAHATNTAYISDEQGKGVAGFPIFPLSYVAMSKPEGFEIDKKMFVIASGATTTIHVIEMFLKKEHPKPPPSDVQEPGGIKDPPM